MNCDNVFCLYNRKNTCILEEAEIDIRGGCISCIYVEIDNSYLEKQKDFQLKKLENDHND